MSSSLPSPMLLPSFEAKQENILASLQISLIQQLYSKESRKERKLGLCLRHSEHAVYDGG